MLKNNSEKRLQDAIAADERPFPWPPASATAAQRLQEPGWAPLKERVNRRRKKQQTLPSTKTASKPLRKSAEESACRNGRNSQGKSPSRPPVRTSMDSDQLARLAAEACDDAQGVDILPDPVE